MAEPQKMIFKTGSVPFKIEKQFYSFIDAYKVEKEKLNTIKKAKNEQLLKKELESKILYNESEILSKLSELEKEFECYMTDYLKKYKEDSDDYNEVSFPVKTAAPLINIIDKIASKFDIIKESQGKRITIYKTKMAPKKETFKEEEKKPINSKNIEKIYNITEKTEENLKKEEEEKSDYQFPPDPIKNFQIKHVLENEIYLKIDPPDDNGDKIFEYNFYDSENTFIKKSHNNEFKLSFSEDLPKFAKNINSDNFFLSFYLTAKNTIGESKMAQIFSIIIRPFKKYQFAISGKDIPLKDDEIGCSFKFSQFYEGGFKNTVNKICLNHSSMMILDGGWVVQWGYSIDSTEFEIDPIKNSELIDEMISTPFYPLKNNNNPILVHSIACGNDFCAVLTMKGKILNNLINFDKL